MRREYEPDFRASLPARAPGGSPASGDARHVVRHEIIRGLRKAEVQVSLAARRAHAGLGVGNEVIQIDDSRFDQRQEAELRRGGVAPGIGDQARRRECARG